MTDTPSKAERLANMIRAYDREPFMDLLEDLLTTRADRETLANFAKQAPDKHMQMTKVAANLAGFADQQVVALQPMHEMSDSQLDMIVVQGWLSHGLIGSVEEGLLKIAASRATPQKLLAEPEEPKDDATRDK